MSNVPESPAGRNPYLSISPELTRVIPLLMKEMKRWTAWTLIPNKDPAKKPAKKPLSLTNDRNTWRTIDEALVEAKGRAGVGFQMAGITSIVGLDLDNCLDPTTGAVSSFAQSLLFALPETYAEVTPSGKGLRLFAAAPDGARVPEFLDRQHGVECYVGRSARFLTLTGRCLPGRERKLAPLTPEALELLKPLAAADGGAVESLEVAIPVPGFERVPEWQKLFDGVRISYKKIKADWRDYLEHGDIPGCRSEKSFGIACKLLELRLQPEEIFCILISAPGSWEAALDKRDQDVTRARQLIWADIGRAQKVVRSTEMALQERVDDWSSLGLKTVVAGRKVSVVKSQSNGVRILLEHPDWRGRIALDVTTGQILFDGTRLDDYRFFQLQETINEYAGWESASMRQWWTDMVRAAAERNPINPREAELRAHKWDGVPRLDTWFNEHVAEEQDALNKMLGRKWLISLVARWLDPGCKVDTVLVLQGVEGARKNTFFEVIAGGPERVVPCDGFDRDDKFTIAQAYIAEMPEASIFRRADRNRLKAFITQPYDHYRPPYAANPVAVKRAFVLVSTSNNAELFNSDQDGLRRFWPVWVKKRIDYEWVQAYREQLLAEAVLAYDLGETWWFEETPKSLRTRVEDSVETTTLDDAIVTVVDRQVGKGPMTLNEIVIELGGVLGYRPNDRALSSLFTKHDIRKRTINNRRVWIHPSWARAEREQEADVVPIHGGTKPEAKKTEEELA